MRGLNSLRSLIGLSLVLSLTVVAQNALADGNSRMYLHKDWKIQSSCEAKATGEQVSAVGFDGKGWHKTDLPATSVGTLVNDKTYPDPTYATNLKTLPGMNYSDKTFFANQDMPEASPFRCSWWYRTEFTVPAGEAGKNEWLNFLGINYRANVWVNGQKIGDAKVIAGTYRTFEFDVTKYLKPGQPNALALEIFAPGKDDLGITWVDWNPTPADKDMGIWKEVFLTSSANVTLRNGFVSSKLSPNYKTAALTVSADLRNVSDHPVLGALKVVLEGTEITQRVELAVGESKTVQLTPDKFLELKLAHPKLWWPYQMGEPHLAAAKFSFEIDGKVSDAENVTYGIREVKSELTDKGHLLFSVNGKKVLIRGAAWAPDMFLRWSSERLDQDLAYVRDMNMNTIRLEGRLDHDEFFEKADRLGILVMPGWTCCDAWERWDDWKGDQKQIAAASAVDQITRLRNHPSVFVFLNGSDGPPPTEIEKMYVDIEKNLGWPNPIVSSASDTATKLTGSSGVKMTGPYEYVPPVYWLTDKEAGGAHGYNTETSPGPAIPTRESLEKFIPKEHLWPIDEVWNYHAGGERFTTINVFKNGLEKRYGNASSLEDFLRKSQAMTYDGQRAMFEAYGRNKYTSTGVIQWMLNNSWPSTIWHLYDYYMVPAGGYFGTKKACETVHVQYSYDDNSVAIVNGEYQSFKGLKLSVKIYNVDATEKFTKDVSVDIDADAVKKALDLPQVAGLSNAYFLKLELHDTAGKLVSDNFYWLSTKADTLDWKNKQDTVYTPQKEFADLTDLQKLPETEVGVKAAYAHKEGWGKAGVVLTNKGKSVAFMINLRLTGPKGADIGPVLWSDNYISLLPGESRTIYGTYETGKLGDTDPTVVTSGWNVNNSAR